MQNQKKNEFSVSVIPFFIFAAKQIRNSSDAVSILFH